jgi:hypothetical protein
MTESMEVEIHGPFSWLTGLDHACIFESPVANFSGVYLWSVPYEGAEMVYYVGETGRSFRDRLKEHLASYLAGLYRVWEPELFARGEKRLVWDGMWRRGEEVRMGDFLARHTELAPRIHQIVRLLRFHLAPIGYGNESKLQLSAPSVNRAVLPAGFRMTISATSHGLLTGRPSWYASGVTLGFSVCLRKSWRDPGA